MKDNAKSIIKFIILQEKKLLSIIENIEAKNLTIFETNILRDLVRVTEKNIILLEKDYNGFEERINNLPITNIILDDFNIDVPKKKKFNYQTNLIFIMKITDNFSRLFTLLLRNCTDDVLRKMLEELVSEKVQLKQRIESIYDKIIAKGK
jgi:hypothetical protein